MNRLTHLFIRKLPIATIALGCALVGSVRQAQATDVNLTDGNSQATVDVDSSDGMKFWSVNYTPSDSGINQLAQQWFWYRIGSSGLASAVNTISAASYNQTAGPNFLTTVYNNATIRVEINYKLTGEGTGAADITESLSIKNNSAAPIDLHFFQYSDFDLAGSPSGDSVTISPDGNTPVGYNQADQTKGPTQLSEVANDPSAQHAEAGLNGSPLSHLTGINGYNLNDTLTAGPGDASWALQWDFTIGAGQTDTVFKDKTLYVEPVPEPSALALIAASLAAFALRRRAQA